MVVVDISSAENTPVTTPVHATGGGISGIVSASSLPHPQPPPRGGTSRSSSSTTVPTLNPFANSPPQNPKSPNNNPFVTASETLTPLIDDDNEQQQEEEEGEGEAVSSVTGGECATAPAAAAATASVGAAAESKSRKPPPLPPRRAASPNPTLHQQQPPSAPRSRATMGGQGEESSGPTSPRSTVSSTTCDINSQDGQLEGSGGGLDAGSVDSSTGSDGTAGGKKYMVVNKVSALL